MLPLFSNSASLPLILSLSRGFIFTTSDHHRWGCRRCRRCHHLWPEPNHHCTPPTHSTVVGCKMKPICYS
ncbi:hypothetical protein QL285_004258 [Trifolium repens]|nr:hypothetical protein QL285_004258 [Trifolium repens]